LPYFVYRIHRYGGLDRVDAYASFKDASVRAKALRVDPGLPSDMTVKVVFAETDADAEALLTQERAPRPGLEGDE